MVSSTGGLWLCSGRFITCSLNKRGLYFQEVCTMQVVGEGRSCRETGDQENTHYNPFMCESPEYSCLAAWGKAHLSLTPSLFSQPHPLSIASLSSWLPRLMGLTSHEEDRGQCTE